ncbi:PD-(D/E)XK nuclease family transposase [Candidatus Venteria ishoeyi]|uniref:PD-(D/E)XK nuclease family transposase n=1 Tax=Candidatus Venteria ishoeyi TaxID=1899563 RepID=A0A1H6FFA7_9GAMM|nr:PD-(D/E)XK nuclease family transposase [Candidatus Venteria ishoeyi]
MHNHSVLELSEDQKKLYKVEKIADIYPEYYLIEVKNFNDIAKDSLDEWIYFLKNEQIKENFTARGLRQAKETLDVLKMNERERHAYEYHQEQLHYEASMYESSYIAAKLEGKAEGILITAKNMKQAGIPVASIAEVTGLSIAQIEAL